MTKQLITTIALLFTAAGCGSTGVSNADPSSSPGANNGGGGADFCSQFTTSNLVCTPAANGQLPHLDAKTGTGPGTVAAGDDGRFNQLDPNKGKYLGEFTPTADTPDGTLAHPGGLMATHGGGIVYSAASGHIGLVAADDLCKAIKNFPGHTAAVPSAHACSISELRDNVRSGMPQGLNTIMPVGTTGRVFDAGIFDGYPTSNDGTSNSFKTTCGDGTYDSADLYEASTWTVVNSDPKNTGAIGLGLKITVQPAPSCPTVYPIACCE